MSDALKCLRCQAAMERGHVPDAMHGGWKQLRWLPGAPDPSFWTGLEVPHEKLLPITAMRCPNCGMLDLYAKPAD